GWPRSDFARRVGGMRMETRAICRLAPAILTWLLVLPPLREDGAVLSGRPVDQWSVNGKFNSEKDCERVRESKVNQLYRGGVKGDLTSQTVLQLTSAKCVAQDTMQKPAPSPTVKPTTR